MDRRAFMETVGAGVAAVGLGAMAQPDSVSGNARKRPNLVFVFPDQMRVHAMGFWGSQGFEFGSLTDPVKTPVLDRFAREALVLTHAVSSHPVCSPYRASLMTGQYSFKNRVHWNCNSNTAPSRCELPGDSRCWSDVLKDEGYSLGYIGKWHLDAPRKPYVDTSNNKGKTAWNEWCPPERRHGFDFWYAYGTFDQHLTPMYWPGDATRDGFVRINQWGPEHEADQAISYIRNDGGGFRNPDRPFALVVSMNPPHTPYRQVPDRYVQAFGDTPSSDLANRPNLDAGSGSKAAAAGRREMKHYLAMVTGVDEQFGRILAALRDEGLDETTLVVFTSDHGNCMGSNNCATKNVHYDEALRIPFLARLPGRIHPRVDDLLFGAADVMPTLLGLLGCEKQIPEQVDGTDFSALFFGRDMPRPTGALYLKPGRPDPAYGERGVRTHQHTLVARKEPGRPERLTLHDNQADPYQQKNIASEQAELCRKLYRSELIPLLKAYADPWLEV